MTTVQGKTFNGSLVGVFEGTLEDVRDLADRGHPQAQRLVKKIQPVQRSPKAKSKHRHRMIGA